MAQLVLNDVSETILQRLSQQANNHERTPEAEAKAILCEALRVKEAWAQVDAIYDRLAASGADFSDSANSLREDRDR